MRENICCNSFFWRDENGHSGAVRADDCTGVLALHFEDVGEEGIVVQVCPRERWLGQELGGTAMCGMGPDVVVMHQNTVPTDEEYKAAIADSDGW